MVELPGEDSAKEVLREASRQGGPIAVMAIMLVAAMLAGIGATGWILIPAIRTYVETSASTVQQNAQSFRTLSESMTTVHQVHTAMMRSTEATQIAVLDNGEKLNELQTIVLQMSEIVQQARKLMEGVPEQRLQQHEEQLRKLQSIDDSLQQLLLEFKNKPTS